MSDTKLNVSVETTKEDFVQTASEIDFEARIPIEVRVTVDDPFTAYRRVRDGEGGVYLNTRGGHEGWGYFSRSPTEWISIDQARLAQCGGSLTDLDAALEKERLVRGDCTVPYPCGLVGWLSYDLVHIFEDIPNDTREIWDLPLVRVGRYDCMAAWREPRGDGRTELRITCCPTVNPSDSASKVYQSGLDRARKFATAAVTGEMQNDESSPADEIEFVKETSQERFREQVNHIQERIRDGDTFQTILSQRMSTEADLDPVTVFDSLREINPAPYLALIEFPDVSLLCSSPQRFYQQRDGLVKTRPLAGTNPRGETPAEDDRLYQQFTASEKEHAEHAMLVDLERNDLGKVSEYGGVEVTDYRTVERYAEVMQMVSTIEGELRSKVTVGDIISAVFPLGTLTGAPKPRTAEIIEEVEETRRGPYGGGIGIFGFDERSTVASTIRTIIQHQGRYSLRVGAGIVYDSDPDDEYFETLQKSRALIDAIDEATADDINVGLVTDAD